jgi:c-di-GMP-binding flagellar brake protein YcgR
VSEQLLVGQAVELHVDGATPPMPLTGVVAALPSTEIVVSLPSGAVIPPALQAGVGVTIAFATTMGLHQARSSVLRVSFARIISVALARFADIKVSQRRQFFRVPASLVTVMVVRANQVGLTGKEERTLTQDVSGGGLRLETTLPVTIGDRVQITLQTPRGFRKHLPSEMSCEAKVVRVEQVTRRNRKLLSVGLQFVFATESERDRWVQLSFDLQRGVPL